MEKLKYSIYITLLFTLILTFSCKSTNDKLIRLEGTVYHERWSKTIESWQAGGSDYYVLVTKDNERIILRESKNIKFDDFDFMVEDNVILTGYHIEHKPYEPESNMEQYPMGSNGKAVPRGGGFVVVKYEIQPPEIDDISYSTGSSFGVNLNDHGILDFLFSDENGNVSMILSREGDTIYTFENFYGYQWTVDHINSVIDVDVNEDGKNDIIIIASCMTGIGPDGAVPFLVAGVYLYDEEKILINYPEVDDKVSRLVSGIELNVVVATVHDIANNALKEVLGNEI